MVRLEFRSLPRVRRTDRRPRLPVVAQAILEARRPRRRPAGLAELVRSIWRRFGDRAWCVADLRSVGFIGRAAGKPLGFELSRLVRDGGKVGEFVVIRDGLSSDGVVYRVTRG